MLRFCDDNSDPYVRQGCKVSAHLKHDKRSYLSHAPHIVQPPSTIAPAISITFYTIQMLHFSFVLLFRKEGEMRSRNLIERPVHYLSVLTEIVPDSTMRES